MDHPPKVSLDESPKVAVLETKTTAVTSSDLGELSPNSVSAAEALSHFKNNLLHFNQDQDKEEEPMDRSETSNTTFF